MISLAATSLADVRSDVADWLKTQGLSVLEGYKLVDVTPDNVQKNDIVAFDAADHVQYGWVESIQEDTVLIGVPAGPRVSIYIGKKKSEIKAALRAVQGTEAFLGPLHHFAVTGPFKPRQG